MKKILHLLVLTPFLVAGQTLTENHIKTTIYKVPVTTSYEAFSTPSQDKIENVTYYDGLGRPIQNISVKQSGNGTNIVTHIEYDSQGRQKKDYLPYKSTNSGLNFEPTADLDQLQFYSTLSPSVQDNLNFEVTNFPYTDKLIEDSPLNRIFQQAAPGEAWKLGSGHEIKFDYQTNIANEVRKFKVTFFPNTTENHTLEIDGFYAANELYKSVVKNENWTTVDGLNKTIQEFKNKEGQIVLKRTFDNDQAFNTYYVYDVFGNLSYVIPPTASDAIDATYNTTAVLNRSYPWTALAEVTGELAAEYNRLFSEYNNELISNIDLFNRFGGQGGFILSTNSNNEVVLTLNIISADPMSLKKGEIVSLKDFGLFKDIELGKISGEGYEYVFTIKNNSLHVNGYGSVSIINASFVGNSKLVFNKNYSWAELADIDPNDAEVYKRLYDALDNQTILTANIQNDYGAVGGINVNVDDNDSISINLNISSNVPLSLKRGIVIPLEIERRIADRELCAVTNGTVNYYLSIKENSLFIEGGGVFTTLSRVNISNPPATIAIPQDIIEGLCYQYHYDERNRLVEKRTPGKGWEYIVYDKQDRVALTQDPNMRLQNKWLFTKYDIFNRVVYSGEFVFISPTGNMNSALRNELQTLVNNNVIINETKAATTFHNNGISINYSDLVFPTSASNMFEVFIVNYYDDYNFQPYGSALIIPSATSYGAVVNLNVKSLSTGSLVRVLGTNEWIVSLNAYDVKGKTIWVKNENSYLQTVDITQMQYDYIDKITETTNSHSKTSVTANLTVVDKFVYGAGERLIKQIQKIDNQAEELIVFNKYDELGTLIQKKVGGAVPAPAAAFASVSALQTIDYTYNVRGWLKSINDPENTTLTGRLFRFKINYDDPQAGTTPLFNGNISETMWQSVNDNQLRKYKYSYDDLNRLTDADYVSSNSSNPNGDYTEGSIQYDKNGNITQLKRYGLKDASGIDIIDNLLYHYPSRSNKLKKVDDTSGEPAGFKDVNTPDEDYLYDINGNMKSDLNKGITNIEYNHLNLPVKIVFDNQDPLFSTQPKAIQYVYDATGNKLAKIITKRPPLSTFIIINTTQYAGSFIYDDAHDGVNRLQYFSQPEGYVANEGGVFKYIYQYKDHLGNVRLSYKDVNGDGIVTTNEIVEESNYYPFGLKHKGYNVVYNPVGNEVAQKLMYNGKEFQDELGLNMYDYGARNYDPAIGRWMNIDPLAETSRRWSPYNYAYDNPVYFVDPDGMEAVGADGLTSEQWIKSSNPSNSYSGLDNTYKTINRQEELDQNSQQENQDNPRYKGKRSTKKFTWLDFDLKYVKEYLVYDYLMSARQMSNDMYILVKDATGSGNNGIGDVAKHTLLMVILTALGGEGVAWDAGLANEYFNEKNRPIDMQRDLINNEWGINWAKSNVKKDNNGIISIDYVKLMTDIFKDIKKGNLNIKSKDNKYVTEKNLKNVIKLINLFQGK